MALHASSSSSSSCSWRFNVFPSFHGPDVRVTFLSHLRKQFERNGIIMFNDQEIERSQTIKPELSQAIQESRILIVVLSQNYASSGWCLNELVEILKCKETAGHIVMTVFYKVDPSDVRKQTGEFGKAFKETCIGKLEMEIQSWAQALTHVANIEGEHTLNWLDACEYCYNTYKASVQHWPRLRSLELSCNGKLKRLTNVPESVTHLDLSYSGIEKISDCIKGLQNLNLSGCRNLKSLPELPALLMFLSANDCDSLKHVLGPFHSPNAHLNFTHCFRLSQQARRAIIQQSFLNGWALLPGREVPSEFDHRARGNSLTIIHHSGFAGFKVCLVISPNQQIRDYRVSQILCLRIVKGDLGTSIDDAIKVYRIPRFRTEHLFVFHSDCVLEDKSISEIVFEFSSKLHDFEIIECGVQIWTDEIERRSYEFESSDSFRNDSEDGDRTDGLIHDSKENENVESEKRTGCWSWLIILSFNLSDMVKSIASFGLGKKTIEAMRK